MLVIGPAEDGWAQVRQPPPAVGLRWINFEYEPHYVRPTWPSVPGGQQIMTHLDIAVEDVGAAATWAVEAGAVMAERQPQDHTRVMFDPAGHPFCLFRRSVTGWPRQTSVGRSR